MREIAVLDQQTIDKIAAGEVIDRPASIVKELVENSIDAGANAVTVEIREGGISFIRITDNGSGIEARQVPLAFLRHATSKIREVEDLLDVGSLGFRGEALSSIAAVCQVELITKTFDSLTGVRYLIEGGKEKGSEEIGAPPGTTFLVRNVFFNTPARKKFLKSAQTEAGYISDIVERIALSHPEVSFKFIANNQTRLHTSGNHNLKDIVYNIYGREIAANLIEVSADCGIAKIEGFIGKPVISRGNRNYENYFVNGRYIRSTVISKAIEDAYHTFMMKHKYPFTALHFTIDGNFLDVNVHPAKMELRFSDNEKIYQFVYESIRNSLTHREMIPQVSADEDDRPKPRPQARQQAPEPFETVRRARENAGPEPRVPAKQQAPEPFETVHRANENAGPEPRIPARQQASEPFEAVRRAKESAGPEPRSQAEGRLTAAAEGRQASAPQAVDRQTSASASQAQAASHPQNPAAAKENFLRERPVYKEQPEQMHLFEDKLLSAENVKEHKIIGQIFDTYWLVEFRDKLFIIDQHAAHEKVMYERMKASMEKREYTSQNLNPPVILTLSMAEAALLEKYMDRFTRIGFEIEEFGGKEYALRAVPDNLFGLANREIFLEMLDGLSVQAETVNDEMIDDKIASMACKAAVKGNMRLSVSEVHALIDELLTLENPYNCPHGRPTIISMTKTELERKFKRIV
ncbi:MAG: DNA mismatch repair endonuclease MutL [Eubacteriales bacterium]|nr:DNA mismatch repair endonuclease MutL [Eubacteriales bacterium]